MTVSPTARSAGCPKAMEFVVEPLPAKKPAPAAFRIRSSLTPKQCLTAAPIPHSVMNSECERERRRQRTSAEVEQSLLPSATHAFLHCVRPGRALAPPRCSAVTLQVWARPLASGAVAAVAFNRGAYPAKLNVTWEMIDLPGAPPSLKTPLLINLSTPSLKRFLRPTQVIAT